jgi:hypothetical protein
MQGDYLTQPQLSQADDLRFFIAAHSVMRLFHPTQTLITSGAPEGGPAGSRLDHPDHPDHLDRLVRAAQLVRPVRLRPHHRRAEPRLEHRRHPAKHLQLDQAQRPVQRLQAPVALLRDFQRKPCLCHP